jgi:hypothetical protein
VKRFNLRKLSDLEVRKQYQIKISDSLAVLENLNNSVEINRSSENVKENFKLQLKSLGLYELKQHKPWLDKECLGFLDQRKQANVQWVQDPKKICR